MIVRRYMQPPPASPGAVTAAIAAERDGLEISTLLVGAALHDADWRAVQALCLTLLDVGDRDLAGTAAICLGHLARIHRTLDVDAVLPALLRHLNDPATGGTVEDALEDIDQFLDRSSAAAPGRGSSDRDTFPGPADER
jgi:hypothetical protein